MPSTNNLISTTTSALVTWNGGATTVPVTFSYDRSFPLAITLTVVFDHGTRVDRDMTMNIWDLSRDLLCRTMQAATEHSVGHADEPLSMGEGDVRLSTQSGSLLIDLTRVQTDSNYRPGSDSSQAGPILQFDALQLQEFLSDTLDEVELGEESLDLEWDLWAAQLTDF